MHQEEDHNRELISRTFQRALFERYNLTNSSNTLSSLVEIVVSSVDHDASATELKSSANYHINNIILLNEYSSSNYDIYMKIAWGKWYIFTIEQTIDDYLWAWGDLGDFNLSSTAHYIFYNQNIWSNEEFIDEYSDDYGEIESIL